MDASKASVEITLVHFAANPDGSKERYCLNCHEPLDVHQPESGHPGRILETCAGCGDWYLLDLLADHERAVMVLLPDGNHFRKVLGV